MEFRRAEEEDIDAISEIYRETHTEEEEGRLVIGWKRGVYPTRQTAVKAFRRGDLYVGEADGAVAATAIINRKQLDTYREGAWICDAPDDKVMVLHTMIIRPAFAGRGFATEFVGYYESLAREAGCISCRLDTNAINQAARSLYRKLGYTECGIIPCTFNKLKDVNLVLLEKEL